MANVFGNKLKLSIFGESHGDAIGIVIDGLPSGFKLDMETIQEEMKRRSPGNDALSTTRKEADEVKIVSGFFNGLTTGAPLCGMIYNTDKRSKDYDNSMPRPGHADLTARIKFEGFEDYRGGGHFSGRLTAPLTFAGAVSKQILVASHIIIGAHIQNIAGVCDSKFDIITEKLLQDLQLMSFPLLDKAKEKEMYEKILNAKEMGDSVGGIIECAALGVPACMGNPFFESLESKIAQMMFSIPAVKGIEFGEGFGFSNMTGSEANDPFLIDKEKKIVTATNNNGGINGGIANGMPIVFRIAIKPTPSIAKVQSTISFKTGENSKIQVQGRHDPCIVIRAVPVIEAALAVCILDSSL